MTVLARDGRNNLWFGTLNRFSWVPTPNRGADVSPVGWQAGGELLSGGAWQLHSFNSAKNYQFEWPTSSSREAAQLIKSYADGTYGRGLIYFVDPLIYDVNVLPAMWADPSMAVSSEAETLVPGVIPTGTPTSGFGSFDLPVSSAFYNLTPLGVSSVSLLDDSNSVFIPIPEGFQLNLGAFYTATGSAGVFTSPVAIGGSVSGLTSVPASTGALFTAIRTTAPGQVGVRLWVGKTGGGAAAVGLAAVHARLAAVGVDPGGPERWLGGQGHSGCRFTTFPTYVNSSGTNGGQVQYAASFREVGSWAVG